LPEQALLVRILTMQPSPQPDVRPTARNLLAVAELKSLAPKIISEEVGEIENKIEPEETNDANN
jgi:hypothetical protein